ncbi:MAG: prolyl oligopeptidase family serine peptidase [Anaerolineaceae bacterium]|nr:prolyl oligopeptidase family serine peptidase [Anaerolineaceae bacterium]
MLGGTISQKRELARAASPVSHVTRDDPPFLIVHGDADHVVPYTQSVKLHEALKKAGVDSTLRTVKGAGHGFRNASLTERVAIDRAVAEFFDKHLKSAKTTDKQAKSGQEEDQGSKKKVAVPAQ